MANLQARLTAFSDAVAGALNKKANGVATQAALSAYSGSLTTLQVSSYGPYAYVPGSSATVDGVYVLAATGKGSGRWLHTPADKRLVPLGVVGDGVADDTAALQAWLNVVDTREHYLPAGIYKVTAALTRTNMGAITVRGAGSGRTKLQFSGDTDGLLIVNPLNGVYGDIVVKDIEITSTGTKSAGRTALRVTSQHEQRPGPLVSGVCFKSLTANQEWTTVYNIHDCSGTLTTGIDVQSASLSVCAGILITNSPGRPSVEHTITNTNVRNAKVGLSVICASTGSNGVEGVQLTNPNFVNVLQGVYAKTTQASPQITFNGGHIQSTGGEAVYLDGYQQVLFNNPLIYSFRDFNTGVTPTRSVYMKDAVVVKGSLVINLSDNTPYALELAGTGGIVDLDILNVTSAAPTNMLNVSGTYTDVLMGLSRTWTGATTYGTVQGGAVTDPGHVVQRKLYNRITTNGTEASIEQAGDTLGGSRLTVQNRGGSGIGALLENLGISLTELFFKNPSGGNAVRYESRGGGNTILPSNNVSGAWQLFTNSANPRISFEHGVGGTWMDRLIMGDNGNHPSAILACTSITQGFLLPRMTTAQRNAIVSPEEGLEIYNLTTHGKEFYNGSAWKAVLTM